MGKRYNKKRINQGRIELFDSQQEKWLALAMVPAADRGDLDQLETALAEPESDPAPRLDKLDAIALSTMPPPRVAGHSGSRGMRAAVALLGGIVIVLLLVLALS